MFSALQTLLRPSSAIASSSRTILSSRTCQPATIGQQVRYRSQYAPRRTKYRKAHKGAPSIPTGGSIRGTSLENGTFGLRVLASTRLTASQLTAAVVSMKRKIKPVKGAEVFMRVFPDIPVCVKGNETRMGKGKGGFEYWACRVPAGRVILEIGGGGIREEIAKQALRLAQAKLPVPTEFMTSQSTPRLGDISSSILTHPPAASSVSASLASQDARGEGGALSVIMKREERRMEAMAKSLELLAIENDVAASTTELRSS